MKYSGDPEIEQPMGSQRCNHATHVTILMYARQVELTKRNNPTNYKLLELNINICSVINMTIIFVYLYSFIVSILYYLFIR